MYVKDTIAAIATPPGRGGIGIVRVSGPLALTIAKQVTGASLAPRRAVHRTFLDAEDSPIDDGIAVYYPGPRSFTGEDVLELQGHGGHVAPAMVMERVCALGARMAAPGEFSQRAFLNDRLDLLQAEAIADLVDSGSRRAARSALRALQGEASDLLNELAAELTTLRIHVEAAIDFPEEEIDFLADERIAEQLVSLRDRVRLLEDEATRGARLREGLNVVLTGRPNAGKSTLMNRLAGTDTAIVTDIPGTTRDLLNETVDLAGVPLHLVDTAGLRHGADQVEAEGIRRAQTAMLQADRVLLVHDITSGEGLPVDLLPGGIDPAMVTVVANKIDLTTPAQALVRTRHIAAECGFADVIGTTATTGEGLAALETHLLEKAGMETAGETLFLARSRHRHILAATSSALARADDQLAAGAGELLAEELKVAAAVLGEMTGHVTADDLLGQIFSTFCIGK